jgi:hypothetical protein
LHSSFFITFQFFRNQSSRIIFLFASTTSSASKTECQPTNASILWSFFKYRFIADFILKSKTLRGYF